VINLNDLAQQLHEQAKRSGFYDRGIDYPDRIACMHEELSELFHAYRKGTLTDLCDKRGCPMTNEAEELADLVIRALDLAAARGVDIDRAVMLKAEYNATRPRLHGDAQAPGERA
jgi:NTP pyrophosphatase (non-canonical NTP hydrolase)